jgi:hypothetical protein
MAKHVYSVKQSSKHYDRSRGVTAAKTYLMERQLQRVGEQEFVDELSSVAAHRLPRRILIGPLGKPLAVFPPGVL